jgi:hypothetical protein
MDLEDDSLQPTESHTQKQQHRQQQRPATKTTQHLNQSPIRNGNGMNPPLNILLRIAEYSRRLRTAALIEPDDSAVLTASVNAAIDSVTKFEQVYFVFSLYSLYIVSKTFWIRFCLFHYRGAMMFISNRF